MADFLKWFAIASKWEGGYVNDPDDRGGETYRGITRRFNPTWPGWVIIDQYKKDNGGKLARNWYAPLEDTVLDQLVEHAAKTTHWDPLFGDKLYSQSVANILVDYAFHSGRGTAVRALQKILAKKNLYHGELDGKFGPQTLSGVQAANPKMLFDELKKSRLNLFQQLAAKPGQKKFLNGWNRRVNAFVYVD